MLLESVQHFVKVMYGEDAWSKVLTQAGLRHKVFTTHTIYTDETMLRLASSCQHVLQDRTHDEFMRFFGTCFVKYFSHYGYDRIIAVCGRNFRDFLHGIDNLHETMRFSFPKMVSPSFYVTDETTAGCKLHYLTRRSGHQEYVCGQLESCAQNFYNISLEIRLESVTQESNGQIHMTYALVFDNAYFARRMRRLHNLSQENFPGLDGQTFFTVRK